MNNSTPKSETRLYKIYQGMKTRCNNPNNIRYRNWGGRGITICGEWMNDFQTFYKWAYANGYQDNLTIDRIDVNGDYEPDNCRWVTKSENSKNKGVYQKNISGYSGVTWYKPRGKWLATIRVDKILKFIGYFDDVNDAIAARMQKEKEYLGGVYH